MNKSRQHVLRLIVGVCLLLISFCLAVYWIVSSNKQTINDMAVMQINKQIKGDVSIGSLSPDFFTTFPNISVQLSDVVIRDSLWSQHHHDLLKAENIYTSFHLFSLLSGKPKINKVIVQDAFIYLYTDTSGYRNLHRTEDLSFKKDRSDFPDITLLNTRLTIENDALNAYHDIEARHLECQIVTEDSLFLLNMNMRAQFHAVSFNLERGSYLKEKVVDGKFCLQYYPGKKTELKDVKLKIDRHPFTFNGTFQSESDTISYDLRIQTQKILYSEAAVLLTQSLQKNIDFIDILQPFDVDATVSGKMAYKVVPKVTIQSSVKNTVVETPLGRFTDCHYTGSFTNQVDSLSLPGDENSKFIFNNVKAVWSNIPVSSTRLEISNLKNPFVICDLQSLFALQSLNELAESSTIRFLKGTGNLDITYNGSLIQNDSIHPSLHGTISLADAEVHYLPRNLIFKNCSGKLIFRNDDLILRDILATAGNSPLIMSGQVFNLLALINLNPEQLIIEWNISSPEINLGDFLSYVGHRVNVPVKKSSRQNKMIQVAENIDRMLSDGTVKINIAADRLTYKKFVATRVAGSLLLDENRILLQDVKLNHSGGQLFLKGSLTNKSNGNLVQLNTRIVHVAIPGLFYAFDNFGQDAITDKNMKGQLTATINMAGVLTDKAEIVQDRMKGDVEFTVKNGELNQFEPLMKIAATAFKKRDFSQVQFAELHNRLDIEGSAITFQKMEIRSNVVILFVEGVYDTKKGTDMSIQVPVSNLSKAENETLVNTGRAGMNIRLRAKTGEDGKVKINWDPFNNATRKREKQ